MKGLLLKQAKNLDVGDTISKAFTDKKIAYIARGLDTVYVRFFDDTEELFRDHWLVDVLEEK